MTTASLSERLPARLRASVPRRAVVLYLAGGSVAIGIYFLLPSVRGTCSTS